MTELNWTELWDETEQRYRVQTRDGRKVRIWTTSAYCGACPIRGEIHQIFGWEPRAWLSDGRMVRGAPDAQDLIPEPRTVRRWVNVYKLAGGKYFMPEPHETKSDALTWADKSPDKNLTYIATVSVEWEE